MNGNIKRRKRTRERDKAAVRTKNNEWEKRHETQREELLRQIPNIDRKQRKRRGRKQGRKR